jgi:hypothetical protein
MKDHEIINEQEGKLKEKDGRIAFLNKQLDEYRLCLAVLTAAGHVEEDTIAKAFDIVRSLPLARNLNEAG